MRTREDLPTYRELILPTLRAVEALGGSASSREITAQVNRPETSVIVDRMDWARSYSKLGGALAIRRPPVSVRGSSFVRSTITETLIGYARCSTDEQDLTAQRQALLALGVAPDRIYIDHGMSGTKRERPGLDQALAAVRAGDTLVVPKLDRLARSVPDARDIGDTLTRRGVALSLGGRTYDPDDPMGKMFFNILATFAEFEVDLIRMRTREGMAVARAQGKLKGRQPKLSPKQQRELKRMHDTGEYTISDLGELFSVSRPTVYRTIKRTTAMHT